MKNEISHQSRKFLAFSEYFSHFFSKSRDILSFPERFREIPAIFFFLRASDERSYQKTGKGRAVWVRRTRKAISRKCKMLSSYSTYPTQWQKKKNTKKTNQPWALLDRSRVLLYKCCRIASRLIVESGCRLHSRTHSRTRSLSLSPIHPLALSHSHTAKFHQNFAEKSQISSKNADEKWHFVFIPPKLFDDFCWNFEIWAVQKYENLEDLEKFCTMTTWLLS